MNNNPENIMQENTNEPQNIIENTPDPVEEAGQPLAAEIPQKTGVKFYVFFMGASIVLLYLFNNFQYMGITQLTETYISCRWAINLCLSLSMMGNFILLLYRPRWLHYFVQIVSFVLAIFALYVIYRIFPFNFEYAKEIKWTEAILGIFASICLVFAVNAIVRYIKAVLSTK